MSDDAQILLVADGRLCQELSAQMGPEALAGDLPGPWPNDARLP